jgi:predicted CXXCH cytochrome family protein
MTIRPYLLAITTAGLLAARLAGDDSVVYSKHDLSTFGPGPVRALEESRVCIFCHAPHNARPDAPLWNRSDPRTHYRIYDSTSTDARIDQPGPSSKLCLSCHDGSIALGLVLSRPPTDPIKLTHTFMPSGESNLTNDLSDDHPVGFRYDRTLSNRDPQLRPPQLVDHRIPLGERGELECIACHDPHNNELGDFLRIPEQRGALCRSCHDMTGWEVSAHALSPRRVPEYVTNGERLPYNSLADNACRSCHLSHNAPQRQQLLYAQASQLCINCHNGVTASDIQPVINQRYGHTIDWFSRDKPDVNRRRVVDHRVGCEDCHNPHAVQKNPAPQAFQAASQGIIVPPAMQAVSGVNLAGLPTDRAALYYEVCFKCHADRPVVIRNRTPRQVDTGGNVRVQILPTAASAHPLAYPAGDSTDVPSLVPAQRARQFIGCQDCHNNPNAAGVGGFEASGPHGSTFPHLLVARYETEGRVTESPQAYALCYQCHDRNSILNDESFPTHRRHIVNGRATCSSCHAPHGVPGSPTNHSHLVNFDLRVVRGERRFIDRGRFAGSCTLTCHGVRHVNFNYGP